MVVPIEDCECLFSDCDVESVCVYGYEVIEFLGFLGFECCSNELDWEKGW